MTAGRHHFTGIEALRYVRTRSVMAELEGSGNDYDRGRRQRCMLNALGRQRDVPTLLRAFPQLVPVIKDNVETDIPVELLPELIKLGDSIDKDDVVTIGFSPPTYNSGWIDGYPVPNVDLIRQTVRNTFEGTPSDLPAGTTTVSQSC
ncbi:MAG: LCP family protein [Chloroflexia bacterium]